MRSETIDTADGWRLGARVHPPRGPRRGRVLLLHAMMVDGRSLDRPEGRGLASTLAEAGLEVWRADLRGRGRSGPTVSHGGRWSYDDLVMHDVPALVAAVVSRTGEAPWVVGHSLGGHVSVAAAGVGAHEVPPRGHVLLAANVWMPSLEGSRRRWLRKQLLLRLFRRGARMAGRWPSRRLRMGPVDEATAYVEDLCRFGLDDAWRSRDGRHDYLAGLSAVTGPVLAVSGARDRLFGHVEGVRAFAEHFGPGRAAFVHLRGGDLGLERAPDHMGLATDPAMRPVWRALGHWMGRGGAGSLEAG